MGGALQNAEVLASKEGPVGGFYSLAKMQNMDLGFFFFSMNMPPVLLLCLLWEGSPCGLVGHRRSQPALSTLLPC